MITAETKDLLIELGQTHYGAALQIFLNEKFDEINSVENCKSFDEVLGRQHAIKLIRELFNIMQNKNIETSKKNQYS